jgi:hypothetical protein
MSQVGPIGELPFYSIKKNTLECIKQIYNFNNIFFIKLVRMNIGGPLKFKSDFKVVLHLVVRIRYDYHRWSSKKGRCSFLYHRKW